MTREQKLNAIFYMVIAITVFNLIGLLAFLDIAVLVYEKVAGIGVDIGIIEKTKEPFNPFINSFLACEKVKSLFPIILSKVFGIPKVNNNAIICESAKIKE
jgi:hypothetical protein